MGRVGVKDLPLGLRIKGHVRPTLPGKPQALYLWVLK